VQTEKKLAEDISLVDMSDIQHERLVAGDVRAIAPGSDLTHRVIHLENPTITLCVKTINEPALKQWTYLQTGLAVQKQNANPDIAKKVYSFQYLLSQNEASAAQFLSDFLGQLDISSQIHLYEDAASGAYGISSETIERIVERIVSLHEGSEWWARYEAFHLIRMNELYSEGSNKPIERLVAHFINSGYKLKQIEPLLKKFSSEPIAEVVKDLMDIPAIFNFDLADEDREEIKGLIAAPKKVVPEHLKQFRQIQLMRDFIL
ncbi:MAG: hypothetical protein AABZ31_08720, partial [Bdellovibrionota bacterium]